MRATKKEMRGWLRGTAKAVAKAVRGSGETQVAIAARAGISRAQLCDICSGKKPNMCMETLCRIACALEINPCDLVVYYGRWPEALDRINAAIRGDEGRVILIDRWRAPEGGDGMPRVVILDVNFYDETQCEKLAEGLTLLDAIEALPATETEK